MQLMNNSLDTLSDKRVALTSRKKTLKSQTTHGKVEKKGLCQVQPVPICIPKMIFGFLEKMYVDFL